MPRRVWCRDNVSCFWLMSGVTLAPSGIILSPLRAGNGDAHGLAVSDILPQEVTFYRSMKRLMDMVLASTALCLLSPLWLMVVLAIYGEDRGNPLFFQVRVGAYGQPFRMWKFRSMHHDAEAQKAALMARSQRAGACFKMKDDPRVTRIGRWLRKTSLDEIPQLVNVLKGDMSLVGPRPALPDEVAAYSRDSLERLQGKPGITCTWQVSGRADISFAQQVIMDVDYLRQHSLWFDVILMMKTIPAVLSGRGAY